MHAHDGENVNHSTREATKHPGKYNTAGYKYPGKQVSHWRSASSRLLLGIRRCYT